MTHIDMNTSKSIASGADGSFHPSRGQILKPLQNHHFIIFLDENPDPLNLWESAASRSLTEQKDSVQDVKFA